MDLFEIFSDALNPVKNAQILNEVTHGQHLYTITLGSREWQTTNLYEHYRFIFSFIKRPKSKSEPFKVSSAPYSGSPINSVVNVKQ